jgi:hypothetical protein
MARGRVRPAPSVRTSLLSARTRYIEHWAAISRPGAAQHRADYDALAEALPTLIRHELHARPMTLSTSELARGSRSGRVAHPFARDFAGRAGLVGR